MRSGCAAPVLRFCLRLHVSTSEPPVLWQAPIGVHSRRAEAWAAMSTKHRTAHTAAQPSARASYQTPERGNCTTAAGGCAPLVAGPPAEEKVTLIEEMQAAGPVRRGKISSGHRSRPPASEAHTTTVGAWEKTRGGTGRHGEARGTTRPLCSARCSAVRTLPCRGAELHGRGRQRRQISAHHRCRCGVHQPRPQPESRLMPSRWNPGPSWRSGPSVSSRLSHLIRSLAMAKPPSQRA
ncbi:hypothetical protein EDB80DRAFT_679286 [Ilyonectria destructans]|nr:hypothetical protein EDB80DRAFT_679286 [Ilyonectria destructans]